MLMSPPPLRAGAAIILYIIAPLRPPLSPLSLAPPLIYLTYKRCPFKETCRESTRGQKGGVGGGDEITSHANDCSGTTINIKLPCSFFLSKEMHCIDSCIGWYILLCEGIDMQSAVYIQDQRKRRQRRHKANTKIFE